MGKHYRLCHRCNHLNHADQSVEQCEKCHKYFVPYFFCDDLYQFFHSEKSNQLIVAREKAKPIIGISFVWRDESA